MESKQQWGFGAFLILALLFLSQLNTLNYPVTTILKPLPIFALIITVWMASIPSSAKLLLMAALVLSSLGDIALTLPVARQIELGLFSFLLAHLCYIMLYHRILKRNINFQVSQPIFYLALGIGLIYTVVLLFYMWPNLGDKMVPVLVYMSVILTMAMLAIRVHPICGIGAVLFVLSDSIIAIDEFVIHAQAHSFAIMVTYYLAQWLLVLGLLNVLGKVLRISQNDVDLGTSVKSA